MDKTIYYLAYDDGNIVIKSSPDSILMRYDSKLGKWIEDVELSRIYFGDMPVKLLTEDEVKLRTGGTL